MLTPLQAVRRGTTAVEVAFTLPVFLGIVFSIIEYGHAQMVVNLLHCACRNAARQGATDGVTTDDVVALAKSYLNSAINVSAASILVKDASVWDTGGSPPSTAAQYEALPNVSLASAKPRDLFLVRATVSYNDVALVPMPFMQNVKLAGQSFMRKE